YFVKITPGKPGVELPRLHDSPHGTNSDLQERSRNPRQQMQHQKNRPMAAQLIAFPAGKKDERRARCPSIPFHQVPPERLRPGDATSVGMRLKIMLGREKESQQSPKSQKDGT